MEVRRSRLESFEVLGVLQEIESRYLMKEEQPFLTMIVMVVLM